jgi:hypothetical protein
VIRERQRELPLEAHKREENDMRQDSSAARSEEPQVSDDVQNRGSVGAWNGVSALKLWLLIGLVIVVAVVAGKLLV